MSHTLRAKDKRTTYFDDVINTGKAGGRQTLTDELGCCNRIIIHLSNQCQEDQLKPPEVQKTQEEQIREAIEWMKKMKSNRNLDLESKQKGEK